MKPQSEQQKNNLAQPNCQPDRSGHCVTCSDEAVKAKVMSVDQDAQLATVLVGDQEEEIDISLVDNVVPACSVLVHGGVAIALA